MEKPIVAEKSPTVVEVKKGETYYWCACGHSAKQPFCDGAHKLESTIRPMAFTAEKDGSVYLCNCKQTQNPPYCDGTHKYLE